jgi:hypothetical protein
MGTVRRDGRGDAARPRGAGLPYDAICRQVVAVRPIPPGLLVPRTAFVVATLFLGSFAPIFLIACSGAARPTEIDARRSPD